METPIKLICHDHPLTPSSGFAFRCYWCKTGGYISNGYHCNMCDRWFHKDCVNGELSWEIRHTSHPEHPLLRRSSTSYSTGRNFHDNTILVWCEVCRRSIEKAMFFEDATTAYDCVKCSKFSLHTSCAIEPPPLTIQHFQAHEHPLVLFPVSRNPAHLCKACKENVVGKLAYRCFNCEVVFHVKCINSPEVSHPCHPKHSLKLLTSGAPDYSDNTCLLCGLKLEGMFYHCSICNFSVCLVCSSIPPPVDVEHLKTHEHKLTLMARQISFTCNACGVQGDRSPYFCLKCDFMVHRSCIDLPRIININRHYHRISHTQQLSFGDWVCQICLQCVNRFYGAYTCSVCSNYVVHSQCATRNDVWDGIELNVIPEKNEDITPFKKVGDNLINHFSHEKHNLKLNKDGTTHGRSICCEACMLPVYSDPVYSCEQCEFILHQICANLPRKKQHMFHNKPFTLHVDVRDMGFPKVFSCSACEELFSGFRYESDHVVLDIRCILTPEFFSTKRHEHPLHYNKTYIGKCDACQGSVKSGAFSCGSCDYNLDYRCASLPETVKYVYDQHPLSLSCKENESGKYWCEICEEEMDPHKWFYNCNDCEVALHVKCVLGDFSFLKPGRVFLFRYFGLVMIQNNYSSRPICSGCGLRCKAPFILKVRRHNLKSNKFVCSKGCLDMYTLKIKNKFGMYGDNVSLRYKLIGLHNTITYGELYSD